MSTKTKFEVGTIVVGTLCPKAGCSNYPQFGKITKITPTGKYRITFLGEKNVDHPKNRQDQDGSYTVIIPTDEIGDNSVLANIEEEFSSLLSKEYYWEIYDEKKEYGNFYDNGD